MNKITILAALAAVLLPLSCGKYAEPASGDYPQTKSADALSDEDSPVITFYIRDAYPAYYAEATRAVPCDVLVYDRHDNVYGIRKGESRSEKQWDILDPGEAPGKRECDVAVIVVRETGEKFTTNIGGIQYVFRIGSYDY